MPTIPETFLKIIEADYAKHHAGRPISLERVKDFMLEWVKSGKFLFHSDNVLFIGEGKDRVFEFHSISGGSGKDLTAGVAKMFQEIAPGYDSAVTYYDNPRCHVVIPFIPFPSNLTYIGEGEDRTFKLEFNLRSPLWDL